jgi:hypothetical protein
MKSGYGAPLRDHFIKSANPINLIDLGGGRFSSATVDTNILIIQNSPYKHKTQSVIYIEKGLDNIKEYIEKHSVEINFKLNESWVIQNSMEQAILEKINKKGTPLSEWNIRSNRGILTGCNEAFYINEEKRRELILSDPKSDEIIKPILRGRDIDKISYEWGGVYIIMTHEKYYDDAGCEIKRIDINEYPAIKAHLDKYFMILETRRDKGKTPYNLRSCAYVSDFSKNKIIYKKISESMDAIIDDEKYIVNDTCHFIVGEYLHFLASFFNSKIFKLIFQSTNAIGGLRGPEFLKSIRAVKPEGADRAFSDEEFYKLYNLTDEEIEYISAL